MQNKVPSVLAVLVTRNGVAWLPRALRSLARQTHPRFGVLAVDNASTDGSGELLERTLGSKRLLRLEKDLGFAGAIRRAMEVPAVRGVDFLLLLHDDVALSPNAVARLVEEAARVPGAGVVGPKVLDWDGRVLLEVGFTTDRFGFPHSPVEGGEIDQGQYDAPREVLFVSSAAMLVSREAIERVGPPDERLAPVREDLDFCWRVRLAGYRVLVTPRAVAVHRMARARGERIGDGARPTYETERAALAAILVNYRLWTLAWVLPLAVIQGLGRIVLLLLGRRFERAGEVLAAWGWNLAHLPGTISRRSRAQRARRVSDREVARFMSPTGARLQRWATQASGVLVGRRAAQVEEGEELEAPPLRQRVASVVADHPVAVAWIAAALVTLVAFREVLFASRIEGGALPVFPPDAASFFRAFASSWRQTGFGGPEIASPALVPLGLGSFVALGNPDLLGRLLVALGPIAAGVSCYASARRLGLRAGAAVVASLCYAVAAPALWAASEGRVAVIVLLVALPAVASRLVEAFAAGGPARPVRWAAGTAMALALAVAFEPSAWVAVVLGAVTLVIIPERRGSRIRGVLLAGAVAVVAGLLLFPFVATLLESGGGGPSTPVRARFLDLVRLSPGPGPGSGVTAAFLPLAGALAFAVAAERRAAWRLLAVAASAIPLAWLAAAGRLPEPVGQPVPYLAAAALSLALLVGFGVAGMPHGVRRAAFGTPQIVAALTTVVLVLGLGGQTVRSLPGGWAVGEDRVAPAWPVVASTEPGVPFRVLWLAGDDGLPFPPPGGDPEGVAATAGTEVAYGVTGRAGRSLLAVGLSPDEPPLARVEAVVTAVLEGRVAHAGALLGPMGIRYVVAGEDRLPSTAARRLAEQVDLDLVQRAGGLAIYRNARAVPSAAVVPGEAAVAAARSRSLLAPAHVSGATAGRLQGGPETLRGTVPEGGVSLLLVADRFDPSWLAWSPTGQSVPFPAFGWGIGLEGRPGPVTVAFDGGPRRLLELIGLGLVWAIALWSVRRRDERPADEAVTSDEVPAVPEVSRT